MKVVILSGSGNVGKTVVAEHLLAPRLKNASLIRFGSLRDQTLSGQWQCLDEVSAVFGGLLEHERCIVDVAGDAMPRLLAGIHRFTSIHASIDHFVIPVTSSSKVQIETTALLERLAHVGVDTGRVRVLFNRVDSNVEDEFGGLIEHVNTHNLAVINQEAAIFENELFDILAEEKLTIQRVMDDETDYKTLLREQRGADTEIRADLMNRYAIKCLTKHVKPDLDDCYAALFS